MRKVIVIFLFLTFMIPSSFSEGTREEHLDCTTIAVGKDASATGSVLIAHNEDDGGAVEIDLSIVERNSFPGSSNLTDGSRIYRENSTLLALPLPESSYAYAWSHMKGQDFSDSYINEKGVVIFSDACPSKEKEPDLMYGGIRYYLRRWVAEQAGSAREAVDLMGQLIEAYGYGDSGRTYTVADSREVWVLHAVYGKHWVAQRVPDDSVMVVSNCYIINGINPRDRNNFRGSSDIISYAVGKGWCESEAVFDFSKAYGDPKAQQSPSNIYRRWLALYLLTGMDFEPTALPFAVKPKEKVSIEKMMSTMRSHFEGTKYGAQPKEALEAQESFHRSFEYRPVCVITTQESSVIELRDDVPDELSVVWWRASCNPCLSPYVPWYPLAMIKSKTDFPEEYRDGDAFHTFRDLCDKGDSDYKNVAGIIKSGWSEFERNLLSSQGSIEKKCYELINEKKDASRILSYYSNGAAMKALDIAKETIQEI